jgi:hypothetical protein
MSHGKRSLSRCARCDRTDNPGHGCSRVWKVPAWLKLGTFNPHALSRSGLSTPTIS